MINAMSFIFPRTCHLLWSVHTMYLLIIHYPLTYSIFVPVDVNLDVPWFMRFVAGLLPRRPGFNS